MSLPNTPWLARPAIGRREWWLVAAIGLLAASWSLVPTLMGLHQTPPGQTYLWTNVPDVNDSQVYYAFIDQNATGQVLYRNVFTGEPQGAFLFHPLWLALGGVERLTGWAASVVFTVARAVLGLVLVGLIYVFISHWIETPRWRMTALAITTFGAGLGGMTLLTTLTHHPLISLYTQPAIFHQLPIDLTYSAGFTWLTLYHSPLFIVAEILTLSTWLLLWRGQPEWQAGMMVGLLGLIHPYDLVLVFGVLITHGILIILTSSVDVWRVRYYLRRIGLMALWTVPAVGYYSWALIAEPTFRQWANQNVLLTTPITTLMTGYGLILVAAAIGGRIIVRHRDQRGFLIFSWAIAALALLYWPGLSFQAKMISGYVVPLSILAVVALRWVYARRRRAAVVLSIVSALITFSTAILFPLRLIASQRDEPTYHYASNDLIGALRWMRANTPTTTVVLGDIFTGNLVPQFAGRQTYLSHNIQTIDFDRKLAEIRGWFFGTSGGESFKADFLRVHHIGYVVWGSGEQHLGPFNPNSVSTLHPVYRRGSVTVYRVE